MSKIKLSFSLLITILLVGILSTAAFAKDPYGLKPVSQGDGNLLVTFTGNTADSVDYNSGPKTYNAISFDVVLKDSTGNIVGTSTQYNGTIDTTTGSGSVTIPAGVMTPGDLYSVELYKTADSTHATLLSKATNVVVLNPHNGAMLNTNTPTTKVDANGNTISIDQNGNGLKNSNLTGYGNPRKNRSSQKIHGFYQNNTNSCASCHQTHTAANGESLLFKDGVYSTCSACHDGTTGAYNNFAPVSTSMTSSIDGTFNVQTAGHNGSLHEADGSLQISAAPGGNKDGGQYNQEFDCASCHAPHGAGSNLENNLNTDPMGWGSVPYAAASGQSITYTKGHSQATITTTIDNKNGKLFTYGASDIIDLNNGGTIPTTETFPYILVKTTATQDNVVYNSTSSTTKAAFNYFWNRAGVTAGSLVIQTYRWTDDVTYDSNGKQTGGGYVPDYSLWNRELGYPYVANTVLKNGNTDLTSPVDPNLHVVWRDAFAWGSDVATISTAVVSIGIDVETTGNIQSLYDSTYVGDITKPVKDANGNQLYDGYGNPEYQNAFIPDSGTEMSKYCASCHVDYASVTRTDVTGVYSQAHRHATLQDKLTCVRCHYAHGSEAQILHDANDNTYFTLTAAGQVFDNQTGTLTDTQKTTNTNNAISYFTDPNPSSALKRYTGMSVCYSCHGKGEQFVGNPNNYDTTTSQFLMGGDPGTTRNVITGK
ncbi:MAG: cytochrome c3 family protein [Bacillota bacterium]|nr:cytochrome c3 family protein [Bacillota bacterium]